MGSNQQVNLSNEERESMIEWLVIWSRYARSYWKKASDEFLELNYINYCSDFGQE